MTQAKTRSSLQQHHLHDFTVGSRDNPAEIQSRRLVGGIPYDRVAAGIAPFVNDSLYNAPGDIEDFDSCIVSLGRE